MQNSTLAQLKLKANEFIQDYQRQVTEREYQKQKLKQNIMLQIMSNRHKSQASQSNPQSGSRVDSLASENKSKIGNIVNVANNKSGGHDTFARSNSVPNAFNSMEDELQSAEITFKQKRRVDIENTNKLQQKQDSYTQQQQNRQEDDENENIRQSNQSKNFSKLKADAYSYDRQMPSTTFDNKSHKYQNEKTEPKNRSQRFKIKQSQVQPQMLPQSDQQKVQLIENDHNKTANQNPKEAIFLTMEEEQSMEISQHKGKNYAFDIAMNNGDNNEDMEEIRKRKISEMERKRQQRLDQFRRQEDIKEQKRPASALKATVKSINHNNSKISDDAQSDIPKSKSRKKTDSEKEIGKNTSNSHEAAYGAKPPQPQKQRQSYMVPSQNDRNDSSRGDGRNYQPTPKTVTSEYQVDKSKGKSNIFRGESPKRLDKSASKYLQQPKIQPKERKNTFVKQSNRKLMITALSTVCLPGELNRKQRQKLTEVIQREQSAQFFVLLFKQYSRKVVKAIYIMESTQTYLLKIYGQKSPQQITAENVQSFYRFDSGSKSFQKLDGCKSFSLVVHAIDLAH